MPELSIIMPLYNTEKYVGKAIQSLLLQSYTDFELIVVNDASTDDSLKVVKSFKDTRIKIITNDQNQGIVFSRNRGLNEAVGKFIAPFDSDDVAMPHKFRKQIDFLKMNADFGMVGSWTRMIDEEDSILKNKWRLPAPSKRIPAILLFRNYFVQSTIVIRREAIPDAGYQSGFDIVEDYIMWIDIARKFKVWNYPEYLVHYRIHSQSATKTNLERLHKCDIKVFQYTFNQLGIELDEKSSLLLLKIKSNENIYNAEEIKNIENLLLLILKTNAERHVYNQKQLTKVIFDRWIKVCYKARNQFFTTAKNFITSPLLVAYIKNI